MNGVTGNQRKTETVHFSLFFFHSHSTTHTHTPPQSFLFLFSRDTKESSVSSSFFLLVSKLLMIQEVLSGFSLAWPPQGNINTTAYTTIQVTKVIYSSGCNTTGYLCCCYRCLTYFQLFPKHQRKSL